MDHSNIFLIIAGTYTPFSVILLGNDGGTTLLWIVWLAALAGIAFRVLWVGAPRWLYTPVYLGLGWVAVFYLGAILDNGGPAVVTLLAIDYRRGLGPKDAINVDLAALYWHFVDVVWIAIFTLVYLIK